MSSFRNARGKKPSPDAADAIVDAKTVAVPRGLQAVASPEPLPEPAPIKKASKKRETVTRGRPKIHEGPMYAYSYRGPAEITEVLDLLEAVLQPIMKKNPSTSDVMTVALHVLKEHAADAEQLERAVEAAGFELKSAELRKLASGVG